MIEYRERPPITNVELNALFQSAWPQHVERDFQLVLDRALTYIGAFDGQKLIGFANLAWDGGLHGFVLDPTVHPGYRRRGIGRALIYGLARVARASRLQWLHVDYEAHLEPFYRAVGFRASAAGVLRL